MSELPNLKKQYAETVNHALAGFQLIEEQLKSYIGSYYDAVRFLLKGKLTFEHTQEEINEAALEHLTKIFSKINANQDLIVRIRLLFKRRNELAHRALVPLYGLTKTEAEFKADNDDFIEVAEKLDVILRDLLEETFQVMKVSGKVRKVKSKTQRDF